MEVKIGVTDASRELTLESSLAAEDIQKAVAQALEEANGVLTLNDAKGRTVFVPATKLAYVEVAGETGRRVGFGAS